MSLAGIRFIKREDRCPFCHTAIGGETFTCTACHSTHHRACWDENKGCTILGCVNNVSPRSAVAEKPATESTVDTKQLARMEVLHDFCAVIGAICLVGGLWSFGSCPIPARQGDNELLVFCAMRSVLLLLLCVFLGVYALVLEARVTKLKSVRPGGSN